MGGGGGGGGAGRGLGADGGGGESGRKFRAGTDRGLRGRANALRRNSVVVAAVRTARQSRFFGEDEWCGKTPRAAGCRYCFFLLRNFSTGTWLELPSNRDSQDCVCVCVCARLM